MDILVHLLTGIGFLVALAATITASRPEDPQEHKGSKRGLSRVLTKKWALRWAIAGIIVATGSHFAGSIKSFHDAKEAKQKERLRTYQLRNQLALAETSLNFLERIVQRLERLQLTTEYVMVSGTNETINRLIKRAKAIAEYPPSSIYAATNPTTGELQLKPVHPTIADRVTRSSLAVSDSPDNLVPVDFHLLTSTKEFPTDAISTDTNSAPILQLLRTPPLTLKLFSSQFNHDETALADLEVIAPQTPLEPSVIYARKENVIIVLWRFDLPSTLWRCTDRMASIQDLYSATLQLHMTAGPEFLWRAFRATAARLDFEKATTTVTNFRSAFSTTSVHDDTAPDRRKTWKRVQSFAQGQLPAKEGILVKAAYTRLPTAKLNESSEH